MKLTFGSDFFDVMSVKPCLFLSVIRIQFCLYSDKTLMTDGIKEQNDQYNLNLDKKEKFGLPKSTDFSFPEVSFTVFAPYPQRGQLRRLSWVRPRKQHAQKMW